MAIIFDDNITLNELIHEYLADTQNHHVAEELIEKRKPTLPQLQTTIQDFIEGKTQFAKFRERLSQTLRPADVWFAQGRFMMELNKFGKNHNNSSTVSNEPAEQFRQILQGLNAKTVGAKIELFYNFLLNERERLRRAGKTSGTIVAAGNSAYIISLFALWLDPEGGVIVCSDGSRRAMLAMIKNALIPTFPDLKSNAMTIEITTEKHYHAFIDAHNYLLNQDNRLKFTIYWSEFFLYWLLEHQDAKSHSNNEGILIKENDDSTLLSNIPTISISDENGTIKLPRIVHGKPRVSSTNEQSLLISHEPLKATPGHLLYKLIQEVQSHILIDEATIKRIYYALLAGHVILTGPPGTGKTELARIIPEVLWKSQLSTDNLDADDVPALTTETAYTTRLVTATDDWSPRTLISGIAPQSQNGAISYKIQYGHLTAAILKNWSFQGENPAEWSHVTLQRTRIKASSTLDRSSIQTFKGQWLVIDEFNRAPIDLALGDALTALGGHDVLRVGIEGGSAELPIPQDFRIIGTLNSFDRHYLNQISEALKRRFSFVEILPPTRAQRVAEQSIVLHKALQKISHLSPAIDGDEQDEQGIYWDNYVDVSVEAAGGYTIEWHDGSAAFQTAFEAAWDIFEVIRIYRQLGTAQAISLLRHMLIEGVLQNYSTSAEWIEQALDSALCDTIADQLQVLLPDEIESLLLYLTSERHSFSSSYNQLLGRLSSAPQRLYGQMLALSNILQDEMGKPLLSDLQIELLAAQDQPEIDQELLTKIFHLQRPAYRLAQFTRRLRAFKSERGI